MLQIQFFKILIVLSCINLITSCQKSAVNEVELLAYARNSENGLYHHRVIQSVDVGVQYRPIDVIIAQELKSNPQLNSKVDSLRKSLQDKLYFTISLSKDGQEIENKYLFDHAVYTKVLQYLSFDMAENLQLSIDQNTLKPITYLYSRMFGSTGHSTVMVVFDINGLHKPDRFRLIFKDDQLGLGTQEYHFERTALENIPKLQFPIQ